MQLKQIFVSNVLEGFYRGYDLLPEQQKQERYQSDFNEANRALFYGADNKVIVTSYPIESAYLTDIKALMGWQNVVNLYPDQPQPALSLDLIENAALRSQLIAIIQANPGIALIPYRVTPEFFQLIKHLRSLNLDFTTPETAAEENEFVVNYFNSKRGFRHLWAEIAGKLPSGIQIPLGYMTSGLNEAIQAAWWFRRQDKSFVLKYNRGVQGIGVLLCEQKSFAKEKTAFQTQLKAKLSEAMWQEPMIIVEELIEPDLKTLGGSPNVELYIDPAGQVHFSYPCEQILEKQQHFIGVYLHPELKGNVHMQRARQAGELYGLALSKVGYRGVFDIDLVISRTGQTYAVESNLRRTGGTHLHEAALALLGANYWQQYHVQIQEFKLMSNTHTYSELKSLLSDLFWDKKKQSGIILCNVDMLKVSILIPILITQTKNELNELEKQLKQKIKLL